MCSAALFFRVEYAPEIRELYAACRALAGANARIGAVGALVVIYAREVIDDLYGAHGADALAFFAGYAAVFAIFACNGASVFAAAVD